MADAQNKAAPQALSGIARHIATKTDWCVVCTKPDYCRVGDNVVGFDSYAFLTVKFTASPNVKAQVGSFPVYRVGDVSKGVEANAGSHVVSGKSLGSGCVKFLDGQNNFKANGLPVVRHDSNCLINCDASGHGGAPGRLHTLITSATSKPPRASMAERMGREADRVVDNKWDELKGKFKTAWEAIPGTSDSAVGEAARAKIGQGIVDTFKGLSALTGPPPEAIQGAYLSGNADSIALVQEMQQQQQQAVGAIVDHAQQSWNEAAARSGKAGAFAMAGMTVAVEIATTKGTGAVMGVAEKIAEITKLAKTPLQAAAMMDKEIAAAKAAGRSAEDIKKLEKARGEQLAKARKEAAKPKEEGVYVKKGRLPPNTTYELNGYKYTTDAEGRIKKVEGKLRLESADRNPYAQRTVGVGDGRLPDDQGGHLIGSQFGGYGGKENLTPMAGEINNYHAGEWGQMEKNWAEQLRAGDSVSVKIDAIYTDSTARASAFKITETINGQSSFKIIKNPS